MPLSAVLEGVALDATLDEPAAGLVWEAIHRVRPRPALKCSACGAGLHAKVSPAPRRLRYFAHDALTSDCPLSGESLDHRLLKVELASAIRAAGWEARLEVPGEGWRADVLGTEPVSDRRIAWEAQLSGQTADATVERTDRFRASDVEVCWVTDKRAPWLGSAPGIRLERRDDGLYVVDGVARLDADWCRDRNQCEDGFFSQQGGPCDGHGEWTPPPPIGLSVFVGYVLHDRVRPHHIFEDSHNVSVPWVWTAATYERIAAELSAAAARRDGWLREQEQAERLHEQRTAALLKRQEDLRRPVMDWMLRERAQQPVIADGERDLKWAMGVPVYFGEKVIGVVCPVASRVDKVAHRFADLVIFVATEAERSRIAESTARRLNIVVLASGK